VVEGASQSKLRFRRRRIVDASAPSTILRSLRSLGWSPFPARAGQDANKEKPMPILSARVNLNKRHTPEQKRQLRDAAYFALYRVYCDVIAAWRSCAKKSCKRKQRCCGDPAACIDRAWPKVRVGARRQIHAAVCAGGPMRVAPVNNLELEMRRDPPGGLK
jgi:hypothetical protein